MLKRKIDKQIQDYFKQSRNALLITGARQTGKTYSIREYGKQYRSFVEINFVETPEAIALFRTALDVHFLRKNMEKREILRRVRCAQTQGG